MDLSSLPRGRGVFAFEVSYLATGQTVDLLITGHADNPVVNSMAVDWELRYPGQTALTMMELYDWTSSRWVFVDFQLLENTRSVPSNPSRLASISN